MPDAYCTCGSALPEGASFCPNCGRPLRPGITPSYQAGTMETEPAIDEPASEARARWDAYLRAAFLPALAAMLLRPLAALLAAATSPVLALAAYAIPVGAGFAAVRLFERTSKPFRSAWKGCGLGAVTGALCFLPPFFLNLFVLATQGKETVLQPIRDQAETFPMATEIARALEDPFLFGALIAFSMALEAVMLLSAAALGGALAVKSRRARRVERAIR